MSISIAKSPIDIDELAHGDAVGAAVLPIVRFGDRYFNMERAGDDGSRTLLTVYSIDRLSDSTEVARVFHLTQPLLDDRGSERFPR